MTKAQLIFYLIVLFAVTSCMSPNKRLASRNSDNIIKIEIGMVENEMLNIMGTP